ncbi:uncharacterized protein TNCV_763141 [Trichonephila clavipes]|nr:uncharacterized protein TNCV_763141 [Trichonephila clavipes]
MAGVNKQNCRIWSEASVQVYAETPLHLEKLTVCSALWAGGNLVRTSSKTMRPQRYVKSLVYADKPQTLDHLEDNIHRAIADIWPQMLEKVIENCTSRLDYIRASRGSPMPEIIFKIKKYFKEDVEFVKELIQYTIEDRKILEEDRKKEAENRLREKELELARLNVRVNSDNKRTGEDCNTLDALVKSVRILTVKVPNRPEGWAFFFVSLERAFVSKNVPEKFKSEILVNLLGEKASKVLTYV